jgi:hypothetical protein
VTTSLFGGGNKNVHCPRCQTVGAPHEHERLPPRVSFAELCESLETISPFDRMTSAEKIARIEEFLAEGPEVVGDVPARASDRGG